MSYGTVVIGRLTLREAYQLQTDVHASTGVRTVVITGEESYPPLSTLVDLKTRHEDIMTMRDSVQPITWTNKSDHDGFYVVDDIGATVINWTGEVAKFSWQIRAIRIGPDNSADIESRVTGVKRQNDFNQEGERWHAPSVGHYGYYTGTTQPSGSVDRASQDGSIRVYRGVPASVSPRWAVPVGSYRLGRARVLLGSVERTGTGMQANPMDWALSNGLVSVTPRVSGGVDVATWDGAAYDSKFWNFGVAASATKLDQFDSVTIIRNDFEIVTLKLMKTKTPGRTTLDLTLRRGSRFVEGYLNTDASTTLAVFMNSVENSSSPASSGYVVASSNDADGNKAIVGTTRTFNTHSSNVRLHKNSVTSLDFYIGAVRAGTSAVDGDEAEDIQAQYIRAMAEFTMAVKR